jgi:hypothetical protein
MCVYLESNESSSQNYSLYLRFISILLSFHLRFPRSICTVPSNLVAVFVPHLSHVTHASMQCMRSAASGAIYTLVSYRTAHVTCRLSSSRSCFVSESQHATVLTCVILSLNCSGQGFCYKCCSAIAYSLEVTCS